VLLPLGFHIHPGTAATVSEGVCVPAKERHLGPGPRSSPPLSILSSPPPVFAIKQITSVDQG
jgi:hypothetical protein